MKDFLTFVFILFFHNVSFNQTLNGQIVELDNNLPIGYASLGILHQNKGTVADSNGYFHFDLSNFSELDTLVISAIGFEKMEFLISHCKTILLNKEILRIELTPSSKELQEVIVTAGKYKNLITGNNIKSPMILAGFQNRSLGAEMGTVLKYNKEKKGLLTNLHFNVVDNKSDTIKFRVNLYEIENGIPNESMLSEPIYFYGTPTNGAITINVSERRIHLKKDIFVAVELIENVGMDGLFFKSAFLRSVSYFRHAPEGKWEKANVDLGMWAEIQYKK
jgi:hypothetical protein